MNVSAKVDDAALQAALKSLTGRDLPAAINFALTRAATTLKKDASTAVNKNYVVKVGTLKADYITSEKSRSPMIGSSVRISGALIPLVDFGNPKQMKQGVKVTVKRGGGRSMYRHAFLANVRGPKRQIYWRAKEGGKMVPRGPLRVLFGPTIAQIVSAPPFVAKLLTTANERIVDTLRQQIKSRVERKLNRKA